MKKDRARRRGMPDGTTKFCTNPECRRAGIRLKYSQFYKIKLRTYGLDNYCKECRMAYQAEWYRKRKEKKDRNYKRNYVYGKKGIV